MEISLGESSINTSTEATLAPTCTSSKTNIYLSGLGRIETIDLSGPNDLEKTIDLHFQTNLANKNTDSSKTSENLPQKNKRKNKEDAETTKKKRKKLVLNLAQREMVLERLKNGDSHRSIAKEFNIGMSTVYDINKRGVEGFNKLRQEFQFCNDRKTFKKPAYPKLDKALKLWVYQEKAMDKLITHQALSEKAKYFHDRFYAEEAVKKPFNGSSGFV